LAARLRRTALSHHPFAAGPEARFYFGAYESRPKRWRDIRSAEHSASGIADVPAVEELIARTQAEYRAADAPDHACEFRWFPVLDLTRR
jgi:hypothetical protein